MIKILNVVGARPNFMKIAPLMQGYKKYPDQIEAKLLHSGQHYDYEMSQLFFDELGIAEPDIYLGIGGGNHASQTARVMTAIDDVLEKENPDLIVVVGDVNPTMATTLVATKRGIKIAHVEAGLRSYDRAMPEEINRIVTDSLADLLLTPSIDGNMNLIKEGVDDSKIHFVGNIMIDTLYKMRDVAGKSKILTKLNLDEKQYGLLTLHRPSNVDDLDIFKGILSALEEIQEQIPLIWPIHPRSKKKAEAFDLLGKLKSMPGLTLIDPIGYIDNICLMDHAKLVLTDSGGIQEETTALGVPCLTIRENTERPITITEGTNQLVGTDPDNIKMQALKILEKDHENNQKKPLYWDGHTSDRIIDVILNNGLR